MFDTNLMLRSAGALNANEQAAAWKNFSGPDIHPLTYWIIVPQAAGTNPTLDLKIQTSDNGSTVQDEIVLPQITVAGIYRFTFISPHPYRRYYATVGGTSPDFGVVVIGPRMRGEYTSY